MTHKLLFADQLRALAVISVMISHYFGIFWFDASLPSYINATPYKLDIIAPSFIEFINYIKIPNFTWGPFGVDIFFLISGIVIPISLEKYSRKTFFIRRFFRIYPTYMVGFSFIIVMLIISSCYFGHPFPYSYTDVILHSVVGLRDIANTPYIDKIIWTLELELKFYILCIIFLPLFKKQSLFVFLIPTMIFIVIMSIALIQSFASMYPIPLIIYMFIGTVFYFHFQKRITFLKAIFLIIVLFTMYSYLFYTLSISIVGYKYIKILTVDGIYALSVFAVSYTFREKFIYNKYIAFISNISYPLYVIHAISGYIIMFILIKNGIPVMLSMIITLIVILSVAYAITIYIEKPSIKLGKKLTT